MSVIKFGTDGWRAKMGGDFSFENVRVFAQGYANFLKSKKRSKEINIILNYDTRFLSRRFADEAAKILSLNGIHAHIPNRDVPLAPISLSIIQNKLDGGVIFTASFNRPIFNGIKVFNHKGAPALPSQTIRIEQGIEKIEKTFRFKPQYAEDDLINDINVKENYIKYLENIIAFDSIRDSGMQIIVDNLYGTSREYLDYVLSENGIDVLTLHSFPYSSSGWDNLISSCTEGNLRELSQMVVERGAHIGLATDIDGDRFGLVDSKGRYLSSNVIMPPLIEYLINVRGMEGGIVKSITTTNNIRRVAEYYSRDIYTTPVGFKYLAHVLSLKKTFIGVESSNGASLNRKITIKDGVLFSLLVAEMLAYYKLDMGRILDDFYTRFPKMYNIEISLPRNERTETRLNDLLDRKKFQFEGLRLKRREYVDGIKFIFDDAWLLIRNSGTNELVRLYAESTSLKQTKALIKAGRSLIE
jgi:phosphoglucomutase